MQLPDQTSEVPIQRRLNCAQEEFEGGTIAPAPAAPNRSPVSRATRSFQCVRGLRTAIRFGSPAPPGQDGV
jgi:hypothetical protein